MKRRVDVSLPFFGCDGQRKAHIVLLESAKNLYEVAINSTISQQLVNGRSYISYNVITNKDAMQMQKIMQCNNQLPPHDCKTETCSSFINWVRLGFPNPAGRDHILWSRIPHIYASGAH